MKDDKIVKAPKTRLLPGDFTKWRKAQDAAAERSYHELNDVEKDIERPEGFFVFPEQLLGNQDIGERDFLVFYFDSHEEYELVREYFENKKTMTKVHPDLFTEKLVDLVRAVEE